MKAGRERVEIGAFLGDSPTRSLEDWHDLFNEDRAFPIESERPGIGRLLVWFRKLLRPFVRLPQNDLWERQRVFNLIALERLQTLDELESRVQQEISAIDHRLASLEASYKDGLDEVMRYNDALYSRLDVKLDAHSELARQQVQALRSVGSAARAADVRNPENAQGGTVSDALTALDDAAYLAFENRQRGSREAIRKRIARYLPDLCSMAPVLDLGCGRGEVLEFLGENGVLAKGVDGNAAMVRHCCELGLDVVTGDLNRFLSIQEDASLGAVTCFHVIEHLPAAELIELLEQAMRVLRPGGLLVLETPNPQSLVVGGSAFWIDATHQKPIHPIALRAALEDVGFAQVEIRTAQPFSEEERLPTMVTQDDDPAHLQLMQQVNNLRDRLDDLLFADRDFAALATKAPPPQ